MDAGSFSGSMSIAGTVHAANMMIDDVALQGVVQLRGTLCARACMHVALHAAASRRIACMVPTYARGLTRMAAHTLTRIPRPLAQLLQRRRLSVFVY